MGNPLQLPSIARTFKEYLHMFYMINFCDQNLWDVECLVRIYRVLNNKFWQEAKGPLTLSGLAFRSHSSSIVHQPFIFHRYVSPRLCQVNCPWTSCIRYRQLHLLTVLTRTNLKVLPIYRSIYLFICLSVYIFMSHCTLPTSFCRVIISPPP